MIRAKKEFNLKIAAVLISIALLWNSALYAGDALRVPIGVRERAEETQRDLGEDENIINQLSGSDTKIIDAALLELDRIPDAGRVKNIIEQVFRSRGLILKRENLNEEEDGIIQILSIDNSEVIGQRPYIINREKHTITFNFAYLDLSKLVSYNFTRHRLLPMLHRWMTTQDFFKHFSGYEIEVAISNFQGARAWWRSGLPIKITGLRDDRVINDIHEIGIDINDFGERYKITGTFLSWEDKFVHGPSISDPNKHVPWRNWGGYLVHTGFVYRQECLLEFYKNPETTREKLFCCVKVSPVKPHLWVGRPMGFILHGGEILYAGQERRVLLGPQRVFYASEESEEAVRRLIKEARTMKIMDFTPSASWKEIDITGAKIAGICISHVFQFKEAETYKLRPLQKSKNEFYPGFRNIHTPG